MPYVEAMDRKEVSRQSGARISDESVHLHNLSALSSGSERLHEICRFRSILEVFAAVRLHANLERETHLKIFRDLLSQMHQLAQRGDYAGFYRCDMSLHRALVTSCGVPSLLVAWEKVASDISEWIQQNQRTDWPSLMALYREHLILVEAWASDKEWIVEDATHHHIEAGWRHVASTLGKIPGEIDPVDRAAAFMSTHYASKINISWIARNISFVSTTHLTRLFRQKLKIPPSAFLRRVRLEHAAELLTTRPEPISLIAPKCGYANVSSFVREFRNYFGTTPKRYRT